ncbi:ComF family protein [Pelagibaculum spongiae]|uniref:Amidophosphoribosyltransferase n=1 Tax=Pelagibaculum spongiae TaxID=2080658 RepID=A0A2V1GNL0_9GAMM|nr:ComF family protein [Pelagibaculum spongiae]PVZ63551.1 amidophosphoribosyltransferase [Pelagibaculum spongiae]
MVNFHTDIIQQLTQWLTNPCQLCLRDQSKSICDDCWSKLPWLEHGCGLCDLPMPASAAAGSLCAQCIKEKPPWNRAISALVYRAPIASLIGQFKYYRRFNHSRFLGQMLAQAVNKKYTDQPTPQLLLPVPLHWKRGLFRGFNQSAEVALELSKGLSIPLDCHCLRRIRSTPSQQGLEAKQRSRNLRKAFILKQKLAAEVRHIALIDDVMTTGATSRELCKTILKQHPSIKIDIWTIARTPKPYKQ